MAAEINPYFATDEILGLAKKVVSVRSLDYDVFAKWVENLMLECYLTGYEEGYNERGYEEES